MKSKKNKNIILALLIFIFVGSLFYSLVNILKWKDDGDKTQKQIINIKKDVIQNNSIDFKKLKNINKDTIGWIKVSGTKVDYPYVKTNNNDYYINHSFDKSYNQDGWLFLDYRNSFNEFDKNNIIYGHALKNGEMFGTLKKVLKDSWLKDDNKHIIKVITEDNESSWEVFSIYHIPTVDDYLQIDFSSNEEFIKFIKLLTVSSISLARAPYEAHAT